MPRRPRWELLWLRQAFGYAEALPPLFHKAPGFFVFALRSASGLTQSRLAQRSGVPRAQISRIETGTVDPQLSTLTRLFEACGCRLQLLPRRTGRFAADARYRFAPRKRPDRFYIRKTG